MTSRKKSRTHSFLTIVTVILIAFIFAITLYIITPKAIKPAPQSEVSLINTPDYGACKVITVDDIKKSTDEIQAVKEGVRVGSKAPNDTVAEGCAFGFSTDTSAANTLTIKVYPYTVTINGNDKETVDSSWKEVEDSDPIAYFTKTTDGGKTIYSLRVIPGGKNVMFELSQPTKAITFDESSARDLLVDIANKADLNAIEPTDE